MQLIQAIKHWLLKKLSPEFNVVLEEKRKLQKRVTELEAGIFQPDRKARFQQQATIDIKVRLWAKEEINAGNAMQKENEYRRIIHHLTPVANELKRRRESLQSVTVEDGRAVEYDFTFKKPSGGLAQTGK